MSDKNAKSTQVQGKGTQGQGKISPSQDKVKGKGANRENPLSPPCPWICDMVPTNVPGPGPAQTILHPRKDVFVLKVAKIGATGDRRCKMELELITPKGPEKKVPDRVDTKGEQCDPDPLPCCCHRPRKIKK